jgi:hypothetical protein
MGREGIEPSTFEKSRRGTALANPRSPAASWARPALPCPLPRGLASARKLRSGAAAGQAAFGYLTNAQRKQAQMRRLQTRSPLTGLPATG